MKTMEKAKKSNKKILTVVLIVALALVGVVGTTYAYYVSNSEINNPLITKGTDIYLAEYFSPDDLWLAGETKEKEVWFGNECDLDQVLRFKVVEEWFDNKGTPGDLTDDTPWTWSGTYTPTPAIINYTGEITGGTPSWTKLSDGYYYYNKVLEKQSGSTPTETAAVISSVTFSPALSNQAAYGDDFSNKVCRITVIMETLDVNADFTEDAWNTTFVKSNNDLTWSVA